MIGEKEETRDPFVPDGTFSRMVYDTVEVSVKDGWCSSGSGTRCVDLTI